MSATGLAARAALVVAGLVLLPAAGPRAEEGGSRLETRCARGADERQIVQVPIQEGCELHYLKGGSQEVVARGKRNALVCDEVQARIRANLERAGFICR